MHRLEYLWPQLVDTLRKASKDDLRNAALVACNFAMRHADVSSCFPDELRLSIHSPELLTSCQIESLSETMKSLDDRYLTRHEEADTMDETSLRWFSQARCLSTLIATADNDAMIAACEAIYEAAHTTEDSKGLLQELESLLGR